jgi:transposase
MIADRYMPLRKAARILGVPSRTMRRWLQADCGLVFPAMGRGRQPLVSESDVQAVIAKRTGTRDWSRSLRRKTA